MTHLHRRAAVFGAVGVFAASLTLALPGASAQASAAAGASTGGSGVAKTLVASPAARTASVSKAAQERALKYWTPKRMHNAKPMDMKESGPGPALKGPLAPATASHGFLGGTTRAGSTTSPAAATASAQVATSEGYWTGSNTAMPAKAIGRLFFRAWDAVGRQYYNSSCSATVIGAENGQTVWTAGHCVYNTYINAWQTNYVFCPGYKDTNGTAWEQADCPFGQWTVALQNTTQAWQNAACNPNGSCSAREFDYDFGALKINLYNGTKIQNWVGSHALRYNIQGGAHWDFGYPATSPFTGQYLYVCIADTYLADGGHLRQPCRGTGGISGGPFLTGFNTGNRAWLDSVNSHGGGSLGYLDGPFQGQGAQNLYDSMRNA